MLKLIYFVPDTHLESTKHAIFSAGAGGMGDYQCCAWQVKGTGQFRPMENAQPFIGKSQVLQYVEEWRVETIVPEQLAKSVKQALLDSHPYEEPAFEFVQLIEI
ncbi:NGG1p interacting factor NIF3 [Acinetobacter qingfengensis]|uniref:NGG1p interacting factor NIF3 n=1 Tax=Acinetobacter qingfengensis TaxID=1262585 RepID=A0A1E7RDN8_9GAMM|nr:NGG1p interacting factor NIF3 [Acinetobacter qingfengensis]KAA8735287.1 NGG1p interacting factor NIF3 [Acinetobacter qingfengensis]OEY97406.1 NGG1p interacting factor NIF3 [Acinetobacter qingfengensis]